MFGAGQTKQRNSTNTKKTKKRKTKKPKQSEGKEPTFCQPSLLELAQVLEEVCTKSERFLQWSSGEGQRDAPAGRRRAGRGGGGGGTGGGPGPCPEPSPASPASPPHPYLPNPAPAVSPAPWGSSQRSSESGTRSPHGPAAAAGGADQRGTPSGGRPDPEPHPTPGRATTHLGESERHLLVHVPLHPAARALPPRPRSCRLSERTWGKHRGGLPAGRQQLPRAGATSGAPPTGERAGRTGTPRKLRAAFRTKVSERDRTPRAQERASPGPRTSPRPSGPASHPVAAPGPCGAPRSPARAAVQAVERPGAASHWRIAAFTSSAPCSFVSLTS